VSPPHIQPPATPARAARVFNFPSDSGSNDEDCVDLPNQAPNVAQTPFDINDAFVGAPLTPCISRELCNLEMFHNP
jgi:hypothetical protein